MYIAIDLIIAVVIVSVIGSAWKRGFIRSVFQLGSTIAAIAIAACFYKQLGAYFYDAFVYEGVAPYISDLVANAIAEAGINADFSLLPQEMPEGLASAVEILGIDLAEIIASATEGIGATVESIQTVGDNFAASLSLAVANILAFAALFFGALILLNLACFILDKAAKLPILHGANKFLGFLLGVIEALLLGMVLAKVAVSLCSAYGAMHADFAFAQVAENTYIAKFLLSICPW